MYLKFYINLEYDYFLDHETNILTRLNFSVIKLRLYSHGDQTFLKNVNYRNAQSNVIYIHTIFVHRKVAIDRDLNFSIRISNGNVEI